MFFCETLKIRCKVVFQTLNKEQLTRVVLKLYSGVLLKSCFQKLNKEQLTRVVYCVLLKRWLEIFINNTSNRLNDNINNITN